MDSEIPDALDGERIDRAVAMLVDRSRSEVARLVADGCVRLDDEPVTDRAHRVRGGQHLAVELPPEPETALEPDPQVDVPVVHEDADIVVVDKPAGIVVHPGAGHETGTLVQGLLARYPALRSVGDPARPGIVHRLDRDTSGLLVVARTPRAHDALVSQLAARTVSRTYAALVWGTPEPAVGAIDAPIGRSERDRTKMAVVAGGREARTTYEVERSVSHPVDVSLVSCGLETGRTHQIRVHLAAIDHPIVGDRRYGGYRQSLPLGRPFLHARELSFVHPATGETMTFRSELPAELQRVLDDLG